MNREREEARIYTFLILLSEKKSRRVIFADTAVKIIFYFICYYFALLAFWSQYTHVPPLKR